MIPRKKIYMLAGYTTNSYWVWSKDFPFLNNENNLENYIKDIWNNLNKKIGWVENIDESIISNFLSSKYNNQSNLSGFIPLIDKKLEHKPVTSVEAACSSWWVALQCGIKNILADIADIIQIIWVEVQHTYKAVYWADFLAWADRIKKRQKWHAYHFPNLFNQRAKAYIEKYWKQKTYQAMKKWYKNCIINSKLDPTAQEYHNSINDLDSEYIKQKKNSSNFLENLSILDCSKISSWWAGIIISSEKWLIKMNIDKKETLEVISFVHSVVDITKDPKDLTELSNLKYAINKALNEANININQLWIIELHDCFTITAILIIEAIWLAEKGKWADYIINNCINKKWYLPINTSWWLIWWWHPVWATWIRQVVTILNQLTKKANKNQIKLDKNKPYWISINMWWNDVIASVIIFKQW